MQGVPRTFLSTITASLIHASSIFCPEFAERQTWFAAEDGDEKCAPSSSGSLRRGSSPESSHDRSTERSDVVDLYVAHSYAGESSCFGKQFGFCWS